MTYKTWPYGTQRKAAIIDVRGSVTFAIDDIGEGHILMGWACPTGYASKGDKGTLTFTKGGPTGGYWNFAKLPLDPVHDQKKNDRNKKDGDLDEGPGGFDQAHKGKNERDDDQDVGSSKGHSDPDFRVTSGSGQDSDSSGSHSDSGSDGGGGGE